jgi:hypothetical protein
LVVAIPKSIPAEKRPEKAHADRTPGRSIRSLFGFSIVKFGIAESNATYLLIVCVNAQNKAEMPKA